MEIDIEKASEIAGDARPEDGIAYAEDSGFGRVGYMLVANSVTAALMEAFRFHDENTWTQLRDCRACGGSSGASLVLSLNELHDRNV
jgi:hypothetical protein